MANEAYDVNKMPEKNPLSLQIDLKKFEKATEDEKKQADIMSESTSFFRDGMKRLRRNPLAMMSIVVLVIIIAMIIVVPSVVPYSYSDIITVNGKRDKTATNMSPFTYSKLEQQYIDEGGKVFPISWERMSLAEIILSESSTEPGFLLLSAYLLP